MIFDDDLLACAATVEKADPDRFRASMASPIEARRVLFPLYAFNIEVARAPWVTQETMIAEMRLQWWRDAVEEIAQSKTVRRHEVVTPLSQVLSPQSADVLDSAVAVRRWDIYRDAFEDAAHFDDYLMQSAGSLMWVAAKSLGAPDDAEAAVRRIGKATGLARFFQAIPELEERGRIPLVDGRPEAIVALAKTGLNDMQTARKVKKALPKQVQPALTEAFLTKSILSQVVRAPDQVAAGQLSINPAAKSLSLWRWS